MHGKILFLAVGTGLDIPFIPAGHENTGIDISPRMLEKARPRADAYEGKLELLEMDVHDLVFPDERSVTWNSNSSTGLGCPMGGP
jgi:ubiquinone/menaquinone biosynthesis C-methylase UbiE